MALQFVMLGFVSVALNTSADVVVAFAAGGIRDGAVGRPALIRRLNEQRVTLRAQLAEQSSTLLDGHPRIKELKAQIGDLGPFQAAAE